MTLSSKSKPTRFLIARDWLRRPRYRFRVWRLARRIERIRKELA